MTVLEAVERSKTTVFSNKGSIEAAQKILWPTENVLWALTCAVKLDADSDDLDPTTMDLDGKTAGVIVLTAQRLLFVNSVMGNTTTKEIRIDDIRAVDHKSTPFAAGLYIALSKEGWVIESKPNAISEFKAALDTVLSAAKSSKRDNLCPYCDSRIDFLPDNHICPSCGGQLPADLFPAVTPPRNTARPQANAQSALFCPHCGTRTNANFCPNCGQNLQTINAGRPTQNVVYTVPQNSQSQRIKIVMQQHQPGITCCPRCRSTDIDAKRRGFSWGIGILGFFFLPFFGLFLGFIGANDLKCECDTCDHTWTRKIKK